MMNSRYLHIFIVFMLLVTALSSCRDKKPKDGRTDTFNTGTIEIYADSSFSPIVSEEVEVFESRCFNADLVPKYTNESDGINGVLDGKVWMMFASRRLSDKEIKFLHSKRFQPYNIPIGYDGFSLIINRENTDSCITVNNIKKILTGEVNDWKQLNPKSNRGKIEVVFDNARSGIVHFAEDSILGGKPISNTNAFTTNSTEGVISYVESSPNAIGILGSNWLNDKRDSTNLTFKRNIRVMRVSRMEKATPYNSYLPYQGYLLNGNYPLVRTLYIILNDPHNGLPTGFSHFVESPIGQKIILKAGLLPYRGDLTIRKVKVTD